MFQTIKTPYYFMLLEQAQKKVKKKQVATTDGGAPSYQYQSNAQPYNTLGIKLINSSKSYTRLDNKREGSGRFTNFFKGFATAPGANINNFPLVKIKFKNGDMAGKECFIRNMLSSDNPGGLIKIGRNNPPGEQVPFIVLNSRTVSREHAIIAYRNHKIIIFNLSTINPVQVDGKEILERKSEYLSEGATVTIGDFLFTIEKVN